MTVSRSSKRASPRMAADPARIRDGMSAPQRTWISRGVVGHYDALTELPEPNPAYVRIEQGLVLVEVTLEPSGDQIVAQLALPDAGGIGAGAYISLAFGARVVVELIGGSPQNAVIIARLSDMVSPLPAAVCGVQTGAAAANAPQVGIPAPQWQFMRLPDGQILAVETGVGGDIMIHAGASVSIAASPVGAIHLNGRVCLGAPPITPPVGATVGPAGTTIPGVPAIAMPFVPAPVIGFPGSLPPPAAPNPVVPPFIGMPDSVIRAKDGVAATATTDPYLFAWFVAVSGAAPVAAALLAAGIPGPPLAVHSEHVGRNGPGSKHTASD